MRSALSVRWLTATVATIAVAVAATLLVAPGAAAPPDPTRPAAVPRPMVVAVDRTLAAGSARIRGTVTAPDGTAGVLSGVTSFAGGESVFHVRPAGAPASTEVGVVTTPAGAWLRPSPTAAWVSVEPELASATGGGTGWAELLVQLRGATDVRAASPATRTRLTARLGGHAVDVGLDEAGRIGRLRFEGGGRKVELHLTDFGAAVPTDWPSPPDP